MENPFKSMLNRPKPQIGSPNLNGQKPNIGTSSFKPTNGRSILNSMTSSSIMDWMVNHTIKANIAPRAFYHKNNSKDDPDYMTNETQRYQIVFVYKHLELSNRKRDKFPLTTVVTLPALNYLLAKRSSNPETGYRTIGEVLSDWAFFGVVNNEEGENNRSIRKESRGRDLNMVVKGKGEVYDVFGGDITTGTKCFFIIKKVNVKYGDSYSISSDVTKTFRFKVEDKNGNIVDGDDQCVMCFQIIPYADRSKDFPPEDKLMGDDGLLGTALYVGRAGQPLSQGPKHGVEEKINDVKKIATSRSIEFFVENQII